MKLAHILKTGLIALVAAVGLLGPAPCATVCSPIPAMPCHEAPCCKHQPKSDCPHCEMTSQQAATDTPSALTSVWETPAIDVPVLPRWVAVFVADPVLPIVPVQEKTSSRPRAPDLPRGPPCV